MPQTKASRRSPLTRSTRLNRVEEALGMLHGARELLRDAGCKNAADYVARALKSVEGAKRHATRMANEEIAKFDALRGANLDDQHLPA